MMDRPPSVAMTIAKILKRAGKPVTAEYLLVHLAESNHTIDDNFMLNRQIKKHVGWFKYPQEPCPHCGQPTTYYSLTEAGFKALAEYERDNYEPTIEEYQEHGIKVQSQEDLERSKT